MPKGRAAHTLSSDQPSLQPSPPRIRHTFFPLTMLKSFIGLPLLSLPLFLYWQHPLDFVFKSEQHGVEQDCVRTFYINVNNILAVTYTSNLMIGKCSKCQNTEEGQRNVFWSQYNVTKFYGHYNFILYVICSQNCTKCNLK